MLQALALVLRLHVTDQRDAAGWELACTQGAVPLKPLLHSILGTTLPPSPGLGKKQHHVLGLCRGDLGTAAHLSTSLGRHHQQEGGVKD